MTRQFFPFFFFFFPSYPVANRFRPLIPAAYCRNTFKANPISKLTPLFRPQINSENPGNDMNEFLEYLASFSLQVLSRPMSLGPVIASVRSSLSPDSLSAAATPDGLEPEASPGPLLAAWLSPSGPAAAALSPMTP